MQYIYVGVYVEYVELEYIAFIRSVLEEMWSFKVRINILSRKFYFLLFWIKSNPVDEASKLACHAFQDYAFMNYNLNVNIDAPTSLDGKSFFVGHVDNRYIPLNKNQIHPNSN